MVIKYHVVIKAGLKNGGYWKGLGMSLENTQYTFVWEVGIGNIFYREMEENLPLLYGLSCCK